MKTQYKNIWPIRHKTNNRLTDSRFSITREYCGHKEPMAVFRFCDDYVSAHKTRNKAIKAAKEYQAIFYSKMPM